MLIRVTIVVWAATLSQQLLAQEYIGSHGGHNDYTIIVDRTYDVMFDIYNEKYIWRRNKLTHIDYKLVLRRKGALVWW